MNWFGLGLVLCAGLGFLHICSGAICTTEWTGPGVAPADVYELTDNEDVANALSADNYFEIPVSSEMWISIQGGDQIGFFTEGYPMITWNTVPPTNESFQLTGESELGIAELFIDTNAVKYDNRSYAFAANIEPGHTPMFLNLPYSATVYTHSFGTVIHTVSVTDLDPDDVDNLSVTMTSGDPAFSFDSTTKQLTYDSRQDEGSYTFSFSVSDTCNINPAHTVSSTLVVTLVNEGPQFTNLPNSTSINETTPTLGAIHTIITTDPSTDTVDCSLTSTVPASTIFSVTGNEIIAGAAPVFDFNTARFYTLTIQCTDTVTTIESVFVVDVIKNEPPTYTVGGGELPASVATDRSSGVNIYTVAMADPEGDTLTYTLTGCTAMSTTCPFVLDAASGVVSTNALLNEAGYDLRITVTDGRNTIGPHTLSVLVSGNTPLTYNEPPQFGNLPATKNVMENTAAGIYLYTVVSMDPNVLDTLTLTTVSDSGVDTYFDVDLTTGVISVKAPVDFDTIGTNGLDVDSGLTINFTLTDGTNTTTDTFTINIENVNEGPSLTLTTTAFTANEGPRGTPFADILEVVVTDADLLRSSDTHYITTSCGVNSKYIYTTLTDAGAVITDTRTNKYTIHFARDYDMDTGAFPSTIACTVTVYDQKRLSDSGTITLNVSNVNDHNPSFDKRLYTFFVSPDDQFEKIIATIPATDVDSTVFGSAVGGLTYRITPPASNSLFLIDLNGVLYVNDVSSQSPGTLETFTITASDTGGLTGTTLVTIIFPEVETVTTTTTTTERTFKFQEDAYNVAWLAVLGVAVAAILIVSVCLCYHDRRMHEYLCWKLDFYYTLLCVTEEGEPTRTSGKLTVTLQDKTLESDQLKTELHETRPDTPESERAEVIVDQWGKERLPTPPSEVSETEADIHSAASDEKEGALIVDEKKSAGLDVHDDVSEDEREAENKLLTEHWGELKLERDVHVSQLGGSLPPTVVEKKVPFSSPVPDPTLDDDDVPPAKDVGISGDTPLPGSVDDAGGSEAHGSFPRPAREYDEPHPSQVGELRRTRRIVPVILPPFVDGEDDKLHSHRVLSPVLEDIEGQLSRSSTIITDPLHTPGGGLVQETTFIDQRSPHVSFHLPGEPPQQPRRRDSKSDRKGRRPSDHSNAADKRSPNARRKRRHRVLPDEPPKEPTIEKMEEPPKPRRYDKPLPDDIVRFPWNDSLFIDKVTSGQQSDE